MASTLLPDMISYYLHRPAAYPLGLGLALTDDVADFLLSTVCNGKVTGDNVGPHQDCSPYSLTSVHRIRPGLLKKWPSDRERLPSHKALARPEALRATVADS